MQEKKSFYEIIAEKLEGKWCDGLAMVELSDDEITVENIFSVNGEKISIDSYPIRLNEKKFSKVFEMDYNNAIKEFTTRDCCIVSPKVSTDEVITFDGCRSVRYGGNVYCHKANNEIIVNDKHHFKTLDEIAGVGFINEMEMDGKWLVF